MGNRNHTDNQDILYSTWVHELLVINAPGYVGEGANANAQIHVMKGGYFTSRNFVTSEVLQETHNQENRQESDTRAETLPAQLRLGEKGWCSGPKHVTSISHWGCSAAWVELWMMPPPHRPPHRQHWPQTLFAAWLLHIDLTSSSAQQIWSSKWIDKQPQAASKWTLKIRFILLHVLLSKVIFINLHFEIHHQAYSNSTSWRAATA